MEIEGNSRTGWGPHNLLTTDRGRLIVYIRDLNTNSP